MGKSKSIDRWRSISRRATTKGIDHCTLEEFTNWFENEPTVCRYCGIEEGFLSKYLSGSKKSLAVDRIDNKSGYVIGNIGLACHACNSQTKGCRTEHFARLVVTSILEAGGLAEYHLWYVADGLRREACYWHQFFSSYTIGSGDREKYCRAMPNEMHFDHPVNQPKKS